MKSTNSMTVNNSVQSVYPLRNKFTNLLFKAGLTGNSLDNAFMVSEHMNKASLLKKLWALSFVKSQEWALNSFNLTCQQEYTGIFDAYVPSELVIPFRNELRFQYTQAHKDFLTITSSYEEYAQIFEQFIKDMGMDKILSAGIMIKVLDFLSIHLWRNPIYVEKTFNLLKSNKDNYIYGGLKNIGLNHNEALTLNIRAKAIANLLENIQKIAMENKELALSYEIFSMTEDYKPQSNNWNTPLAHLGDMLKENGYELPDGPDESDVLSTTFASTANLETTNETDQKTMTGTAIPTLVGTVSDMSDDTTDSTTEEFSSTPNIVEPNLDDAFKPVTAHEVLQNMDVLKEFIRVAEEVAYAGFSVKEVLEKQSAIRKLLDGFEALS